MSPEAGEDGEHGVRSVFAVVLFRELEADKQLRYIYPAALRMKMVELWGIPDVAKWWLPNGEGLPDIIRSIRAFIEDRTVEVKTETGEDLRSLKAIFSKLNVDDSPKESPESSGSATSEGPAYNEQTAVDENMMLSVDSYVPDTVFEQLASDQFPEWTMDNFQADSQFHAPPGR